MSGTQFGGVGIGSRTAPTYSSGAAATFGGSSNGNGAPVNYVAGVGRGAMGFTTRSDIGPARAAGAAPEVSFGQAPAGYVAGRGRGMGDLQRQLQQQQPPHPGGAAGAPGASADGGDRGDYSESNYDEFSGYSERLFAVGAYDKEDIEADDIYREVDEQMDSRRKRSREQQQLLELKKARFDRPRIADQFADLKQQLKEVSALEWDAIPEVGDHTLKLKQQRKKESFVPVPDSVLLGAAASVNGDGNSSAALFDPLSGGASVADGTRTSATLGSGSNGFGLAAKLDKMSDSVTGQTMVDPRGYLTSLNSLKVNSAAEVGDIKKARLLLKSVTTTNPKHGPGWIAAARVEEFAGKLPAARKIILQGCETVPESEDVWLEAARLHADVSATAATTSAAAEGRNSAGGNGSASSSAAATTAVTAKTILANAVMHIPTSVRVWLQAAELEGDNTERRKAVLRRSLEVVPNSVKLWKAAIELENVSDARIMLARAVECVPHSAEMWLALARLETHENARRVLNQAREAIPTERLTWITAARLEEAHGSGEQLIDRIIAKMIASLLGQYQVAVGREQWLQEAMDCEAAGAPLTCAAIVRHTIHLSVDAEDRRSTWMDDADSCLTAQQPPRVVTARAILDVALAQFPSKKSLWQQAALLEKEHGDWQRLEARLRDGVRHCPQAEVLWLMAAKEKWQTQHDVGAARAILLEAFNANPRSQQIWLAAVKLEWENDEFLRARLLLSRARERASSERVWLKSALLERETGDFQLALQLLQQATQRYPAFAKFYLMAAQICEEEVNDAVRARQFYLQGIKSCPCFSAAASTAATSNGAGTGGTMSSEVQLVVSMWRLLMRLEERVKGAVKARPTGELARAKLPSSDLIWLECIRLERRAGNMKQGDALMAKAMQQCPKSGALWAEEILTCQKQLQKSRCIDALRRCIDDPLVLVAVARLFERGNRPTKARKRFERAVTLHPQLGDAWIHFFCFEYALRFSKATLFSTSTATAASVVTTATAVTAALVSAAQASADAEGGGIDSIDDEHEDAEDKEEENQAAAASTVASANQQQQGTDADEESHVAALKQLAERCALAAPNAGEIWCAVSKATANRRKPVVEQLLLAAEAVLGRAVHPAIRSKTTLTAAT